MDKVVSQVTENGTFFYGYFGFVNSIINESKDNKTFEDLGDGIYFGSKDNGVSFFACLKNENIGCWFEVQRYLEKEKEKENLKNQFIQLVQNI